MPDIPPGARVVVRNRRPQPVELHLPGGVVVLAPQGECDLDRAAAATPQVAWLVARKVLQLQVVPAPAAAAPAPRAAKKARAPAPPPARKTPRPASKPKRKHT